MTAIAALLDVLDTALETLVNLGSSRVLRGNAGSLITTLPPLPNPPVRAESPPHR
jgi:hypothetical protein